MRTIREEALAIKAFHVADRAGSDHEKREGGTVAQRLQCWLCAEIDYQQLIGIHFIQKPEKLPDEGYQLELWGSIADILRTMRLQRQVGQFKKIPVVISG